MAIWRANRGKRRPPNAIDFVPDSFGIVADSRDDANGNAFRQLDELVLLDPRNSHQMEPKARRMDRDLSSIRRPDLQHFLSLAFDILDSLEGAAAQAWPINRRQVVAEFVTHDRQGPVEEDCYQQIDQCVEKAKGVPDGN